VDHRQLAHDAQIKFKGKMTNQYSIEIHNYVSERIKILEDQLQRSKAGNDPGQRRFLEGQFEEFLKLREYMHETIDLRTQAYY
jgi:hypothetical protein